MNRITTFICCLFAAFVFVGNSAAADYTKRHFTPEVSVHEYSHHTSKKKSIPKAEARIHTSYQLYVKVNLKRQRMYVYRDGKLTNTWKISGGTKSYPTPVGKFSPGRMYSMFYATNWNDAEMPYSIFFRGAYAIHGTKSVSKLGRPASHGCIRLKTSNAKKLYNLVKKLGRDKVRIEVTA